MRPFNPVSFLSTLIEIPSFSKDESKTADIIESLFLKEGYIVDRLQNNIIVRNSFWEEGKPTILLNSHHDTVKPNSGYSIDPFNAFQKEGKLFGLGSNDAGGCLVSLISTFLAFGKSDSLSFNLVFIASAEEEISGKNGIALAKTSIPTPDLAIIGEPTSLQAAVAEKGLAVFDGLAKGKSGHVAHGNTINPISIAVQDIQNIEQWTCKQTSDVLGDSKLTIASISAPSQHNVIPSECHFIVDARINEHDSIQSIEYELQDLCSSQIQARSYRLQPSFLPKEHFFYSILEGLQIERYGSPTLSDQALLNCPSIKIGPGNSLRSHQANEFIYVDEIHQGIQLYNTLLTHIQYYYETLG